MGVPTLLRFVHMELMQRKRMTRMTQGKRMKRMTQGKRVKRMSNIFYVWMDGALAHGIIGEPTSGDKGINWALFR